MRTTIKFIFLYILLSSCSLPDIYAQNGDVSFWIPSDKITTNQFVPRNTRYFSIRVHSAFVYYKSGFFENIKNVVVASDVTLIGKTPVQGTQISKTLQKIDNTGDFIAINDHLVAFAPTTPTKVVLKGMFRGIGEDRFKIVFDTLADPAVKTAMNLSPATSAAVGAITPIVQKLLATPFTEKNPRQVLDIETSYLIYDTFQGDLPTDALCEGFLVVLSSRNKGSNDLRSLASLQPGRDIRISPMGGLEYQSSGRWVPVNDKSYIIFSVTTTLRRGPDQEAAWFAKFREAVNSSEDDLVGGKSLTDVKINGLDLWRQGSTLLFADQSYIDEERRQIRAYWLNMLQQAFKTSSLIDTNLARINIEEMNLMKEFSVPTDFVDEGLAYAKNIAAQFIVPPESASSVDRETIMARTDKLSQLPKSSSDAAAMFAEVKKECEEHISDPNTMFLVLMKVIDNYAMFTIDRGLKDSLLDNALQSVLGKAGVAGDHMQKRLTDTEEQAIRKHAGAVDVLTYLKHAGYTFQSGH